MIKKHARHDLFQSFVVEKVNMHIPETGDEKLSFAVDQRMSIKLLARNRRHDLYDQAVLDLDGLVDSFR